MNIQAEKLSLINGKQYHAPSEMDHAEVRDGRLYVMVEVSAPMAEWDNVSRELVARVIDTFAVSQLTDSQALNEAAIDINNYLIAHNDILPQNKLIWAGVNALFIRDNQLFLAQAGPALTYIIREQLVTRYPPSNPKQMPIPLGEQHDLPCRLGELELQPNDMIVLTASHLPFRVSEQVVHDAMQHDTLDEIMVNLVSIAGNEDFSALAVQYEPTPEMANRSTPVVIAPPTIPLQLSDIDEQAMWGVEEEKEEGRQTISSFREEDNQTDFSREEHQDIRATAEVDYRTPTIEDQDQDPDESHYMRPDESESVDAAQRPGKSLMDDISAYVSQLPDYQPVSAPAPQKSNPLHTDRAESRPTPVAYTDTGSVSRSGEPVDEVRTNQAATRSTPTSRRSTETTFSQAGQPYSYASEKKTVPPYRAAQPPRGGRGQTPPASANEPRTRTSSRRRHDPFSAIEPDLGVLNEPADSPPPRRSESRQARQKVGSLSIWRRIGIGVLAILAWVLGALSAAVGGLHQTFAPRVTQVMPSLDRISHSVWHGGQDLLSTSWQSLRQLRPGYQKRPRKAKRAALTPTTGDGSDFMRLSMIVIPVMLLLIGLVFWTIRGETDPALAAQEMSVENEAEAEVPEEEAIAEAAQNAEALANALIESKKRLETAASSGPEIARRLLGETTGLLMQAETFAAEDPVKSAEVSTLQLQVEVLFDQLNNVKRPMTTMLAALEPNSQPKELVYGVNTLFVWVGDAIYSVDTGQPSTDLLQSRGALLQAEQPLPSGDIVNGNPKALAWVTFGNGRPYDAMILLTENGQLIEYESSLKQKKLLIGSTFETKTQASEAYNGNLYLLDRIQRQIWKYTPDEVGNYINEATGWVAITDHDNMGRPVDLAIDGYIFLLDESGQVRRFQGGSLYGDFALQAIEPPLSQGVALVKAPDDKTDMFVADRERIMRFTPNGELVHQYRVPLDASQRWGQIHDITIHPEGNQLYVLADNGIYFLDLLNLLPPPDLSQPIPDAVEPAPDVSGPQIEEENSVESDFFEGSPPEAEPTVEAEGEEGAGE